MRRNQRPIECLVYEPLEVSSLPKCLHWNRLPGALSPSLLWLPLTQRTQNNLATPSIYIHTHLPAVLCVGTDAGFYRVDTACPPNPEVPTTGHPAPRATLST